MKFIDSYTDKDKGLSVVFVSHRGKLYKGQTFLHEDDTWSDFTGCRIAETKAKIKALRREKQDKKRELRECQKFVNSLKGYKEFTLDNPLAKKVIRQLKLREKEYAEVAFLEEQLKESYRVQSRLQDRRQKQEKPLPKNLDNSEE